MFAGIGSQAMALRNIGAEFTHYRVVESDKFAIKSYNAIHNTDFPLTDIQDLTGSSLGIENTDRYCYIMCYSYPCQDLSLAGRQKGMAKGSGTRSGLLWEVERLLNETTNLPQILIMENVSQVHNKKNLPDFMQWISFLKSKGYSSYYDDLNAKEYGIPQNRKRCFMVSALGDFQYVFPRTIPLKLRLKDILEPSVDLKYYISQKALEGFISHSAKQIEKGNHFHAELRQGTDIGTALRARYYKDGSDLLIAENCTKDSNINKVLSSNQQYKNITNECYQKLYVREATKKGYAIAEEGDSINLEQPHSKTRRGRVGHSVAQTLNTMPSQVVVQEFTEPLAAASRGRYVDSQESETKQNLEINYTGCSNALTTVQKDNYIIEPHIQQIGNLYGTKREPNPVAGRVYASEGLSPTLKTMSGGNQQPIILDDTQGFDGLRTYESYSPSLRASRSGLKTSEYNNGELSIRKLTPKECWRLMGFSDNDFDKAQEVNSNTQLYKQAGNSIVVNCLEAIFRNLHIQGIPTWDEINE